MKNFSKNLPCLQTVGPWWSEDDRRTLFCYLLKIFPFEADYLSASRAASFICNEAEHAISAVEIKNDFDDFMKKKKSLLCTCTAIKRHRFSFGKLNGKICHLCPYCSSYSNYSFTDESRFISYLIKLDPLPLSEISESLAVGSCKAFISHIPIYVGEYLIDAYPISLYLEPFLNDNSEFDSKNSEEFFVYVKEVIRAGTLKKLSYLRTRQMIADHYPDYEERALQSAYNFFEQVIDACENIQSVSINTVQNLYNILSVSCNKKHYKKPTSFYNEEMEAVSRRSFVMHTIEGAEEKMQIIEEDQLFDIPNKEQEASEEISDPLRKLLDEEYQTLPTLEDNLLQTPAIPLSDCLPDLPIDSHLQVLTRNEAFDNPPTVETEIEITAPEEILEFHEFYQLINIADTFVYGNGNLQSDNGILTAFTTNCSYLCMEAVTSGDNHALLMINPAGERLLYSLELFGPKAIRNIADQGIPVYTSCRYLLSLYLFRNKVYKLNILDVGIAYALKMKVPISGIASLNHSGLLNCMRSYSQIYEQIISTFDEIDKVHLKRLENYSSLLCSDGENAPFKDISRLCKGFQLTNFLYAFENTCIPIHEGTFMQVRILAPSRKLMESDLIKIYMDACISLNTKTPFWKGFVHILKMNANCILVYVTGNTHTRQKIQLYLSSCIRRAFSSVVPNQEVLSIEEQFLNYAFKDKSTATSKGDCK